jgi:hypothetical protein
LEHFDFDASFFSHWHGACLQGAVVEALRRSDSGKLLKGSVQLAEPKDTAADEAEKQRQQQQRQLKLGAVYARLRCRAIPGAMEIWHKNVQKPEN